MLELEVPQRVYRAERHDAVLDEEQDNVVRPFEHFGVAGQVADDGLGGATRRGGELVVNPLGSGVGVCDPLRSGFRRHFGQVDVPETGAVDKLLEHLAASQLLLEKFALQKVQRNSESL